MQENRKGHDEVYVKGCRQEKGMAVKSSCSQRRRPVPKKFVHLSNWGSCWCWNHRSSLIGSWSNTVRLDLRAVLGDVTNFTATVAGFASFAVQWSAVRCSAVARDMSEFATGVAFHCLCLAIASIVVWSTTLVAGGSSRNTTEAPTASESWTTTISATRSTGAASDTTWDGGDTWTSWASAVALGRVSQMSMISRKQLLTARWPGCPQV
jgi:hypothetical protein